MGPKTILKPIHRKFLEAVNKEKYLTSNYYWTGGTVLSEFFLHHRESEDIDLFIEKKEVHLPAIKSFIEKFSRKNAINKIAHSTYLGLESFLLTNQNLVLKVDFNYYPFPRIEIGKKWKNLAVDSLLDIAVNKIHTVSMRPRTRDFVDLYFILNKFNLSVGELIKLAKAKFDWHIDPIQLGLKMSQVVTKKDYPKMIVSLDPRKMEDFFLNLAKSLEKNIFE